VLLISLLREGRKIPSAQPESMGQRSNVWGIRFKWSKRSVPDFIRFKVSDIT
jgi:hypothetical protein